MKPPFKVSAKSCATILPKAGYGYLTLVSAPCSVPAEAIPCVLTDCNGNMLTDCLGNALLCPSGTAAAPCP